MGEVRVRFEFPGGASEAEIWPDDCPVNAMLPRVISDARERDRAFTTQGKDWGLFLKRSGGALARDATLATAGVQSGDVLVLRDESELRARRDAYLAAVQNVVAAGFIEPNEAAELGKLRAAAQMDEAAARMALTGAGVAPDWVDRVAAEKEHYPDELAAYRKNLQSVPRDGHVPEDLHRLLTTQRAKLKITPELHRKLCKKLGCTDALAERLLVDLPPKEDGLAAYRKELEFLKKQTPQTVDELKPLVRLQKQHKISPSEHQMMALEIGFTAQEAELIWDGIPPRMVEREAALEAYRTALKQAWLDRVITPAERANLAALRQTHKISAIEHMKVCKELKIPQDIADGLLKPAPAPTRAVGRMIVGGLVVVAAAAAAAWSLSGKLSLPGMPAVNASNTHAMASPAPEPAHDDDRESPRASAVPMATPVPSATAPAIAPPSTAEADGAPAASKQKGVVLVTSEPSGAVVVVDGKVRGVAPLEITESPGQHWVLVKMDGYYLHKAHVQFVGGERRYHKAELKSR